MKKILVANWKMNPVSVAEAVALAKKSERAAAAFSNAEVVVAPPTPFLIPVARVLKKARLASQNVFWEDAGPYTGEVSVPQLKSVGASHVIIGHSERKIHLGETDGMIAKKVAAAADAGITVILCIGEEERDGDEIPAIVGEQFMGALAGIRKNAMKNIIVCYEPVWAISTMSGARPCSPDDVFRAAVYIRKMISVRFGRTAAHATRIVYGGSVGSENIASYFTQGAVEGALIGGASLVPGEFRRIVEIVSAL